MPSDAASGYARSIENAVASAEQSPDNTVMDLSKLPRLSQSKGQVPGEASPAAEKLPEAQPAASQPVAYNTEPPVGPGEVGNIWLSLIIGLVVMLMGLNFAKWAMATLLGQTYDTGYLWPDGRPVAYWELQGHTAVSDSALFLFGLACVLEAAAMAAAHARPRLRTATVSVALLTTLLATAYNAVACVVLFRDNVTPLLSLLAVGFGGYMAFAEWGMLRSRR